MKLSKILLAFIMVIMLSLAVAPTASVSHADSIIDTIRETTTEGTGEDMIDEADKAASDIIANVRQLGVVGMVIMIIWMGIAAFFSHENLMTMKKRAGALLLFIILVFKTEPIVGFILDMVGYQA